MSRSNVPHMGSARAIAVISVGLGSRKVGRLLTRPLGTFPGAVARSRDAKSIALKQLMLIVHRQAVVMTFADVFLILSMLFVALAVLAVVMKRPTPATRNVGTPLDIGSDDTAPRWVH